MELSDSPKTTFFRLPHLTMTLQTPVSAPAHTAAAPSSATATAPSQRFANDLSLPSVLLSLSVAYILCVVVLYDSML